MKRMLTRLGRWNRIFCDGMTCKTNVKRDAVIISIAIALSATFIGTDWYLSNKKIQTAKIGGAQIMKTLPEKTTSAPETSAQNESDSPGVNSAIKPATQTLVIPRLAEVASMGASCIKIPANILSRLKGAPTPPDGRVKNGKLICHVLADGRNDHPQKSKRNPKGQWGGCCYDPDEIPNPNCCYPVGSVYEKPLRNYFANPFSLRK